MHCPKCHYELQMLVRQGVELDHCPECRGIWLDRGELDKLLDRSSSQEDWGDSRRYDRRPRPEDHYESRRSRRDDDDDDRRPGSFWRELFDF